MYEPIKEWYQSLLSGGRDTKPGDVSILVKLLSGVTSGALASGIFNPTDVSKPGSRQPPDSRMHVIL